MSFINADIRGARSSLRIVGTRIDSVGEPPRSGDCIVDLRGDRLLPGLINSHDHLQLNHYARLRYRDRYDNVSGWIEDVGARLDTDEELVSRRSMPRDDRLLIGGIKNLLSGVTTVAHHDPVYEYLRSAEFPVRVPAEFGWSHSLGLDGEARVSQSYRETPKHHPWIIHAAEGVDASAAQEIERLAALDCLSDNTVIVHGVAMTLQDRRRILDAGAGVVWCPASNLFLLGATLDVTELHQAGRVALGSDSRLSGEFDLLTEMRVAMSVGGLSEEALESLVTTAAAQLLRVFDRGMLAPRCIADLLILPEGSALSASSRGDVRLVMIDGRFRYGDEYYARQTGAYATCSPIKVDGIAKRLDRDLAKRIARSAVSEAGVDVGVMERAA